MQSVPRKLALGMILAAGVAACGDDVTVSDPPDPPAPVVRSVVVSPSSATIAQGGTFQFGASVDADAGVVRTVTWTASGGSGVTVDANGLATASATATGPASICATSTADAGVKGCAQLAITPAAAPATVQIDQMTVACEAVAMTHPNFPGACGLLTPVNPTRVFGQMDVKVAINRPVGGVSGVTGVRLEIVNATTGAVEDTYTQTLTGQFLAATEEELAAQQTVSNDVTFSVQTAKYDLSGAGGTAKVFHPNGPKKIRASLIGPSSAATVEQNVTFTNANGFHLNITQNLTAGTLNENGVAIRQVNAATGLVFVGGTDLGMNAIPVSYTGQTVAANAGTVIGFGSGCDLSGVGARAIAATVAGGIISGTLPYTVGSGAAATDIDGYQISPVGACAAAGEVPFVVAVDATGNPFINLPLAAVNPFTGGPGFPGNILNIFTNPVNAALSTVTPIRLDNGGPAAIAGYTVNPNGRQNGWFNGEVIMNARSAVNANGVVAGAQPADPGIGGATTLVARGGACTSVGTCAALAPRVRVTDATALAESPTGATYNMIVQSVDLFGNVTNPGAVNPFGVDVTIPAVVATPAGVGTPPAGTEAFMNALNGLTPSAATWTFTAVDVAPALPAIASGIRTAGADPRVDGIELSLVSRTASATVAWCPATAQLQLTTVACANAGIVSGWLAGGTTFGWAPGAPIAVDPSGANTQGYYSFTANSVDQAGNRSAAAAAAPVIFDITPPVQTALNNVYAIGTTTTPGSLTANAGATDNLDLGFAHFQSNYTGGVTPGLAGAGIAEPASTTGAGKQGTQLFGFNLAGPSILAFQFNRTYANLNRTMVQVGAAACPAFLAVGFTCGTPVVTPWAGTSLASTGFLTWDVALNPAAGPLVTAVAANAFAGSHPLTVGFGGGNTFSVGTFTANPVAGAPPATADAAINAISGSTASGTIFPVAMVEVVAGGQSPFVGGLDFYYLDTELGVWVKACTATTPTFSIANTTWSYHCPSGWVPRTQANASGYLLPTTITGAAMPTTMIAVGRTVNGDALMSNPHAITITR